MRSSFNQVLYHTAPQDVDDVVKGVLSQRSAGGRDKRHSRSELADSSLTVRITKRYRSPEGIVARMRDECHKGKMVRMRDEWTKGIRAPMHEDCSDDKDSSKQRSPHTRLTDRSVVSGARGKTAPVCLAFVTATGMEREAKPKRWLAPPVWLTGRSEQARLVEGAD